MKTKRMIAVCLAAALLSFTFAGCEKTPERVEVPEPVEGPKLADLVETDTLVLYIPQNKQTLKVPLITQYESLYDVKVEKVIVPGHTLKEYSERVINDLLGGSGPDILFLDYLDMDIVKAAMNNQFLDLTDVLTSDPGFSEENYIDGVFEAACIGGRQYTVPRSYRMSVALSSREKLEELGFSWDGIDTMADFLEEIAFLTPYAEQETSFMQMLYSKNNFYYYLLTDSGISLIDYETGEVLPDEKNLRSFLEAYKAYFPYDYDEAGGAIISSSGDRTLISGTSMFWIGTDIKGISATMEVMEKKSCDYIVHPIPGQTKEVIGDIYSGLMAISANAKNSLNAYNFIKYMLSEDVQKDEYKLDGCFPIHRETLREKVYESPSIEISQNVETWNYEEHAFSDEEAEMLIEMLTEVDRFVLGISESVKDMLFESMLPYFQDEKSYDDCLKDLKNKLTLYLSE